MPRRPPFLIALIIIAIVAAIGSGVHEWHTDIESAAPDGRFVSVWIGLDNTCKKSALSLASRSHRFGKPIQQVVNERRLSRSDATNDAVAAWAREFDRAATIV